MLKKYLLFIRTSFCCKPWPISRIWDDRTLQPSIFEAFGLRSKKFWERPPCIPLLCIDAWSYMVLVWSLYGPCMVLVWSLYGPCMVLVWSLYGPCMVLYGILCIYAFPYVYRMIYRCNTSIVHLMVNVSVFSWKYHQGEPPSTFQLTIGWIYMDVRYHFGSLRSNGKESVGYQGFPATLWQGMVFGLRGHLLYPISVSHINWWWLYL